MRGSRLTFTRAHVVLAVFSVGLVVMVGVALGWSPFTSDRVPHRLIVEDLDEGTGTLPLTQVITSAEQLAAFETMASEILSDVDFEQEVVVVFDLSESGPCPIGPLEAVEVEEQTGELRPVFGVRAGEECASDENPHRIIVAIDRDDLPPGSLTFEF